MHNDPDDRVHALFRRIDDGPPLGIDVHDVMTRGRQARTRRTGLAVAGSVLAVAAAVVVGVSLGGGIWSPDPVQPAETPRTTTAPPPPSPPATSPPATTPEPEPGNGAPPVPPGNGGTPPEQTTPGGGPG
jgi:hypothetical protein